MSSVEPMSRDRKQENRSFEKKIVCKEGKIIFGPGQRDLKNQGEKTFRLKGKKVEKAAETTGRGKIKPGAFH